MSTTPRHTEPQTRAIAALFVEAMQAGLSAELVSARPDGSLVCYEVTGPSRPRPLFVWVDDEGKVTSDGW